MILRWLTGVKSLVMIDKLGSGAACALSPPKFEVYTFTHNYGKIYNYGKNFITVNSGWM